MTDSLPVRCPACRREQSYTPPTFPCPCGAPLTLPVQRDGTLREVDHRTWEGSWVTACCPSCGRRDHWPQPEFGCPCGAVVRVPVAAARHAERDRPAEAEPSRAPQRPAFQPVTVRTARDAVLAAAQYLRWLGFTDLDRPEDRAPYGVDVRGSGVVAQVDPTTRPTAPRAVECLWLHGLQESAVGVFFSLAGYEQRARERADALCLPLYVLDLAGTPQPVNDPADALILHGPPAE